MALPALRLAQARQLRRADALSALTLLEFQSPTAALLATPVVPAARGIVWIVLSMVVALFTVLGLIPVDMTVTAPGRVVSLQPTMVVQPLETSIVRAIYVHEGQVVRAGEILAQLDPTFSGADAGALEAQVSSFQAEVDRLTAEGSGSLYVPSSKDASGAVQAAIFAARQAQYRSQMDSFAQKTHSLEAQLVGAQSDVRAYQDRLQIATELEAKKRELERLQVGSQINRMVAQDARLEIQRSYDSAISIVQRTTRDLAQMSAERESFQQQWSSQINQDLNEKRRSLSEAKESLIKAKLRHNLVDLRATQDAIVLTLSKVSVGSVMQSGDQFVTLVPTHSQMRIEARIDGADSGYVHQGENVAIKFDTFSFIRYGMAEGSVQSVSADSFNDAGQESQRTSVVSQGTQSSYYTTNISVDKINMHDVPGGFQLKPGMSVTADIKVGQRTALLYLMGQVLTTGQEGMREP